MQASLGGSVAPFVFLLYATFLAHLPTCYFFTPSSLHTHSSHSLTLTLSPPIRGNGSADLLNLWVVVLKCPSPTSAKKSSAFSQPEAHVFHSTCSSQASVSCSGWLEAGFYVVIPFSFLAWQADHEGPHTTRTRGATTEGSHRSADYVLSVFSSRDLILDKVHLRPGFIAQSIHLLAKKFGKRIQVRKWGVVPQLHVYACPVLVYVCVCMVDANGCMQELTRGVSLQLTIEMFRIFICRVTLLEVACMYVHLYCVFHMGLYIHYSVV